MLNSILLFRLYHQVRDFYIANMSIRDTPHTAVGVPVLKLVYGFISFGGLQLSVAFEL